VKKIPDKHLDCEICGAPFTTRGAKKRGRRTCSAACKNKLIQKITSENSTGSPLICKACGKHFTTLDTTSHHRWVTCSPECRHALRSETAKKTKRDNLNNRYKGWAKTIHREQSKEGVKMGASHLRAVHCVLVSPDGEVFEFTNLQEFVRTHENLFLPEDLVWRPVSAKKHDGSAPRTKGSMICRASCGLQTIKHHPTHSWKGFVFLSCNKKENK